MPTTIRHIEPNMRLSKAERDADKAAWNAIETENAALRTLILEAHDLLHAVLTTFITDNDTAHSDVSTLMARIRSVTSADK